MTTSTFQELGLQSELLAAVQKLGYTEPSAIQAKAIPPALAGKDLIGLSQTGSGKTAAFALPALQGVDLRDSKPQVLVLAPTRELAIQISSEIHRLGSTLPGLGAIAVYGGAPIDRQIKILRRGVHVVVGTPGRLLDHLRRRSLNLSQVKMVVLDEADRMLDMGFQEEMESVLEALPEVRQTLFFSATMNRNVERLIRKYGNNPQVVEIKGKALTVDEVEQQLYVVAPRSRIEVVSRIVDVQRPQLTMVFCNTRQRVDECAEQLAARGYAADRIHGDISQHMREQVLRRFRSGAVKILVATDVAARGLDIRDVDMVINFDLPSDPEDYVHRIGRTGRAGDSGLAISFAYGRDLYRIQQIERYTRKSITELSVPTIADVEAGQSGHLIDQITEHLASNPEPRHTRELEILSAKGHDAAAVTEALFELLRRQHRRERESIPEDHPRAKNKRDPRERAPRSPHDANMQSLHLNVGKRDGVRPADIVRMLHGDDQLPKGTIGRITLFPTHSLIDVKRDHAHRIVKSVRLNKMRGRQMRLDIHRPKHAGTPTSR